MKKNLRNVLALALGLLTTVSFAQDWNVDSRTRIDNGGDFDRMITKQRATIGATWGGSDWGIHVSSDVNYTLGAGSSSDAPANLGMNIYEAYASTNLFGMANMTIGRQALDYGSGALISSNQWNADRTTWDGASFDLGLSDMADITVGYARMNDGVDANSIDMGNMYANIAGSFSGWDVNIVYMTQEGTNNDNAATGVDISGGLMGANVNVSMNTDFDGDEYRVMGLTYNVNDDMSIHVASTTYGDKIELTPFVAGTQADVDAALLLDANASTTLSDYDTEATYTTGFNMNGTNMNNGWDNGNMGYLNASDEMLSYGVDYNMGGITLGATMNKVTNEGLGEAWERSITEISIGYSLGDNASLSYHMATDGVTGDVDPANNVETKYSWLTLTVTP